MQQTTQYTVTVRIIIAANSQGQALQTIEDRIKARGNSEPIPARVAETGRSRLLEASVPASIVKGLARKAGVKKLRNRSEAARKGWVTRRRSGTVSIKEA